jgi:hypothetical protein
MSRSRVDGFALHLPQMPDIVFPTFPKAVRSFFLASLTPLSTSSHSPDQPMRPHAHLYLLPSLPTPLHSTLQPPPTPALARSLFFLEALRPCRDFFKVRLEAGTATPATLDAGTRFQRRTRIAWGRHPYTHARTRSRAHSYSSSAENQDTSHFYRAPTASRVSPFSRILRAPDKYLTLPLWR